MFQRDGLMTTFRFHDPKLSADLEVACNQYSPIQLFYIFLNHHSELLYPKPGIHILLS